MIAAPAQTQGLLISQFSLRHGIAEYPLRAALRRGLVTLPRLGRVSIWPADPAAAAAIVAKLREHRLIDATPAAATA